LHEVHHEDKGGFGEMRERHNAKPSHFELASKGCRRRSDKAPAAPCFDRDLIVGNQPSLKPGIRWEREEAQRKVGFAGAWGSAQ
jgi:hypothetical protein